MQKTILWKNKEIKVENGELGNMHSLKSAMRNCEYRHAKEFELEVLENVDSILLERHGSKGEYLLADIFHKDGEKSIQIVVNHVFDERNRRRLQARGDIVG